MRILSAPTGDEGLAHICFIIAIGVAQPFHFAAMHHDHAIPVKHEACGDTQFVSKNFGMVHLAIPIGVFEDFQAITTRSLGLELVGVVDRFGDPQAPTMIKG